MGQGGAPSRTPGPPGSPPPPGGTSPLGPELTPALSGQISRVSIADLLTTLESRGRPAVVRFTTSSDTGHVWFAAQGLVDAEIGDLQGEAAIYRILGFRQGTFEVFHEPVNRPRAIQDPIVSLISKRVKRSARWHELIVGGPPLDAVLALKQPLPREAKNDDERAILAAVDGRRTLLEVLDESRLDPVHALAASTALETDGFFIPAKLNTSRPPPPRPFSTEEEHRIEALRSIPVRSGTLSGLPSTAPSSPPSSAPASSGPIIEVAAESAERARSGAAKSSEPRSANESDTDWGPELEISVSQGPDESGLVEKGPAAARSAPMPSSELSPPTVSRELERSEPRPSLYPSTPPPPTGGFDVVQPGAMIGSYRVLLRLARGHESSVYLCRHEEQGSIAALAAAKLLDLRADAPALEAFLEGARIPASLNHPNVVRLIDRGSYDSHPMLLSEYVEGSNLRTLLSRHPRSRPAELIAAILFDALRGLQAIHEYSGSSGVPLGLVHGELSPRDLLIGTNGTCRVADVALSHGMRTLGDRMPHLEKLAYLSPERLTNRPLDARCDVFSAGAILYEALTGIELFRGSTPEEVRKRVLELPIEPPSRVGLRPSSAFDEVCLRALQRDPDRRYESAREMLMLLEQAALDHGTLASASDAAEWMHATFGRDLELRRLAVLDASRRLRASQRPPAVSSPPPVHVPSSRVPAFEAPRSHAPSNPGAIVRVSPGTELTRVSASPPVFDLSQSEPVPAASGSGLARMVAAAAVALIVIGGGVVFLARQQARAPEPPPPVTSESDRFDTDFPRVEPKPRAEPKAETTSAPPAPSTTPPAEPTVAEPEPAPERAHRPAGRRSVNARARQKPGNPPERAPEAPSTPNEQNGSAAPTPTGEPPPASPANPAAPSEPAAPSTPKDGDPDYRYGI
jgi:eukaryotic-like serine/threonine-protein kinase